MFVDTMQKEKSRVMSLIKLALLLASEALPSTKFPAIPALLPEGAVRDQILGGARSR
jgi:hypothetical protein